MDDSFKFFKDMRNVTVKERTILPNKRISMNMEEKITITESVNVKVIRNGKVISEDSSFPSSTAEVSDINQKGKEYKVSWFFIEYPDKDLLDFCQQYVHKLSKIVEECTRLFKLSE
jgi:hypothetical protein